MKNRESGFTLIELMIVIAIIAIIAAIAIPNLLAAKLSSNETAAIATLRNLTSCQAQIQTSGKIDVDNDGIGEFGTFLELTGTANVRKALTAASGTVPAFATVGTPVGTKVTPAVLSPSLANVDSNGFVTKAGYAFMIFLPDNADQGSGAALFAHETNASGTYAVTPGIAIDLSEQIWCAYGQPVARGNSGNRRFFVNQAADVMQSSNENAKQQGTGTVINGNSGFHFQLSGGGITGRIAVGATGFDGDIWKVTN
jgi:prepilin-type N-terminal cleavage/methylation domain-containing protein